VRWRNLRGEQNYWLNSATGQSRQGDLEWNVVKMMKSASVASITIRQACGQANRSTWQKCGAQEFHVEIVWPSGQTFGVTCGAEPRSRECGVQKSALFLPHSCRKSEMRTSEPKPHEINKVASVPRARSSQRQIRRTRAGFQALAMALAEQT